ncbi:MAG: putative heme transporter [Nocardioidaceae bacterium]|nr:putative heme transporter [Nocardioidaceae bacterium]
MGLAGRVSSGLSGGMARLRSTQQRKSDERFAERFAQQWASLRAERRPEPPPEIHAGASNYARAQIPYGMDLAAAWSWRVLVLGAALYVLGHVIAMFAVVVLPLVIALLLTALVIPVVDVLTRSGVSRGFASFLVVLGSIGVLALLLTFAGQQVAQGASDLSNQVVTGLAQIEDWLKTGPLHASDSQINGVIKSAQDAVTTSNAHIVSRLTEVTTAVGHIVAGVFIILFSTYFFLADGRRIWAWVVRIFPRASRARADSSGGIAWTSLTAFVRATVLVAFTDALGIMIVAAILRVPFVFAIGVLVFIGAFIPMIGATLSGSVAVLVALVDQGPVKALIMLGGVIAVQQLEAHVLQPFLLGRLVSVHPLGVILAIAGGVLVAGIAGALVAVPFVAAANAVVLHLSDTSRSEREAEAEPLGDTPD